MTIRKFADFAAVDTGEFLKVGASQVESVTLTAADISDLVAVIAAAITDGTLQIVLKSPDNTLYTLSVSNAGAVETDALPPP